MGTATRTLADAARAKRVALAGARDRYERSLTTAAATRLIAERAAANAYIAARAHARGIAQTRRLAWRGYHATDTDDLWFELRTCEFQLSSYCAPYLTTESRRDNTQRTRMIRTELQRRGLRPDLSR